MAEQILGPYLDRTDRTQKRCNIQSQSTGKIINSTIVSAQCPRFMKSPFESNREHFEKNGVAEEPIASRHVDIHNHPGGQVEAGKPAIIQNETAKCKRTQIVHEDSGKVFNLSVVSNHCPDWMKSPFESNREQLNRAGHNQNLLVRDRPYDAGKKLDAFEIISNNKHLPTFATKGAARMPRPGDWTCRRSQIVHEETGQLNNHHTVSFSAPDFMHPTPASKPLPHNDHPRPRSHRGHPGPYSDIHAAGLTRAETCDDIWGTKGHASHLRSKKVNLRVPETGELKSNTMVSGKAPQFMNEPFDSNKRHLESRNLYQAIHTMNCPHKVPEKPWGGSRKVTPQEPSYDVPDWMIQEGPAHQKKLEAALSVRAEVDHHRRAGNTRAFCPPSVTSSVASRSTTTPSAAHLHRSHSQRNHQNHDHHHHQRRSASQYSRSADGMSLASSENSARGPRRGGSVDSRSRASGSASFASSYMYGSSCGYGSEATGRSRTRPGDSCPGPSHASRSRASSRSSSCRSSRSDFGGGGHVRSQSATLGRTPLSVRTYRR